MNNSPDYAWRIIMCVAIYCEIILILYFMYVAFKCDYWIVLAIVPMISIFIANILVIKEHWND